MSSADLSAELQAPSVVCGAQYPILMAGGSAYAL